MDSPVSDSFGAGLFLTRLPGHPIVPAVVQSVGKALGEGEFLGGEQRLAFGLGERDRGAVVGGGWRRGR